MLALPALGAGAYTGASLVSDDSNFAIGFAWGVATGYLYYGAAETPENVAKIGKCLSDGHITSGVFHDAVVGVINDDPSMLPKDATYAALTTLYKICPVR